MADSKELNDFFEWEQLLDEYMAARQRICITSDSTAMATIGLNWMFIAEG